MAKEGAGHLKLNSGHEASWIGIQSVSCVLCRQWGLLAGSPTRWRRWYEPNPPFCKIILAVVRGGISEAGAQGGWYFHLCVSWLRILFYSISRVLSLDLLVMFLMGQWKQESTRVLRINSKIPPF